MINFRTFKNFLNKVRNEERNFGLNCLEYLAYLYRRNNWMLDFRRYWSDFEEEKIEKPVFLLGFEGGGLTVISRMIRRHKDLVSVSGNFNYWSGADEMQLVLGPILPQEFTGIKHNLPSSLSKYRLAANFLYANNDFLPHYRNTKQDVTPGLKRKFRKILRWMINRHAVNGARFIDKSQVFTVKVSFINEILEDTDPKFILITRNPYAICFRAARGNVARYLKKKGNYTHQKALRLAGQHWKNSMDCALKDRQEVKSFFTTRLEDILDEPEQQMRRICNFLEIEFKEKLLPQPDQKIPFGTKSRGKWYPLRSDVNEKYLDKISQEEVEIIDDVVEKYARKFNYEKPQVK